jgi:hypothetical protein
VVGHLSRPRQLHGPVDLEVQVGDGVLLWQLAELCSMQDHGFSRSPLSKSAKDGDPLTEGFGLLSWAIRACCFFESGLYTLGTARREAWVDVP